MVNAIILFNLFLFRNSPAKSVAETTEQQNGSKSIFNSDVHASRKRPKLEIRRGETGNASQMESDTENTHVMNGLVLWDGIVVEEKESNELSQGQDRNINESVMKKPFGFGNKSQQCIAFIESKGRQCEEARDVYGKSMRCRFPYDDKERIILTSWRRFILFMNAMNSADALGHVTIEFYRMESALNLKFLEQKARDGEYELVNIYCVVHPSVNTSEKFLISKKQTRDESST
ncbi:hypothetical protein YC2023_111511 [Brassica napus]